MCVEFLGPWEVTDKDIIAYKIVRSDRSSMYPSEGRDPQNGDILSKERGEVFVYEKGSTVESGGYGIYCFVERAQAYNLHLNSGYWQVLKVRIPAGTRVAEGHNYWGRTINASKVIVLT